VTLLGWMSTKYSWLINHNVKWISLSEIDVWKHPNVGYEFHIDTADYQRYHCNTTEH
jgi:hypothetical protein